MKRILATLASLVSAGVMAYGVGHSASPLPIAKKLLSTELTGITSDNGGMGVQVRYTQKMSQIFTMDAGIGINGGDRGQRLFVGADYEIYPDYLRQPRISVKAKFERAEEFDITNTNLTLAPTVSKGMMMWGSEAQPFVAVPIGLTLNDDEKSYDSVMSVNAGITGHLPVRGYRNLLGSLEIQFDLKNSYTGVLAGLTFPMN